MRFLIHELPYEQPVAAGRYTYQRDGISTGATESWRVTEAVDGYRILRVDLDARQAESGDSYLYHMTLNPAGRPERLNFRFFRPGLRIQGNVLFETGQLTLSREVNGERLDNEQAVEPGTLFWFPAAAGLSLVSDFLGARLEQPAVMLDPEDQFSLRPVKLNVTTAVPETVLVRGSEIETQPVHLLWGDQERKVWLDKFRWPVKVHRGYEHTDLWAITSQYARYKRPEMEKDIRITRPGKGNRAG